MILKLTAGIALFPFFASTLSSCSVAMAANRSGTDVGQVQKARTRGQLIALGAQVIGSDKDADGNLVESYRIQKEKGSVARALMHGVLDVSTLGLWEAIGTPIEGSLNKKEYFSIKVLYDKDENVKKVELL